MSVEIHCECGSVFVVDNSECDEEPVVHCSRVPDYRYPMEPTAAMINAGIAQLLDFEELCDHQRPSESVAVKWIYNTMRNAHIDEQDAIRL